MLEKALEKIERYVGIHPTSTAIYLFSGFFASSGTIRGMLTGDFKGDTINCYIISGISALVGIINQINENRVYREREEDISKII